MWFLQAERSDNQMSVNSLTRAHHFSFGLCSVFIGALASYVGFALVGVQIFGEVEFDKVIFLIGSVSLVFGPALIVAGIRLIINKPTRHGGLLSPLMLRVVAVLHAIVFCTLKPNPFARFLN